MVTLKKLFFLIIISLGMALSLSAQELKVVSTGQGTTEDEATKIALRSALEDAYGTFISSSTKIENDVLVSDEIVSLTQGNIKEYDVVNSSQLANGLYSVTVESVVSLNELATYCQSKGMSITFNGKAFGMELQINEFNRRNEIKILKNLCLQLLAMNPQICDYELMTTEPKVHNKRLGYYEQLEYGRFGELYNEWIQKYENDIYVKVLVIPKLNSNYQLMKNIINSTLRSISLTKDERKKCDKLGVKYYTAYYRDIYVHDSGVGNILGEFLSYQKDALINNWVLVDNIKGSISGISLSEYKGLGVEKDYLFFKEAELDIVRGKEIDFQIKSSSKLSYSTKLVLFYKPNEISDLKSIEINPFNQEAYETIIKPKLLSIIAEFDNIK